MPTASPTTAPTSSPPTTPVDTPAPDAAIAAYASLDFEVQERIEAIDATMHAQAEQALDAAIAAVLCSNIPS